jgi:hypothetical protein
MPTNGRVLLQTLAVANNDTPHTAYCGLDNRSLSTAVIIDYVRAD